MTSAAIAIQDPSQLWDAVVARNRKFDGALYYGVATTHIYCRPSCASRRPKPENVQFFFDPESAESAGFRACKRCHPREIDKTGNSTGLQLVREVCRAVERNVDSPLPMKRLSGDLKMHPATLDRHFKQNTGITIKQYAQARRLSLFKTALRFGRDVTTAIYEAGYNSSSRVYEHANAKLGMTPSAYSKGGNGARIRYAIAPYAAGKALLGVTDKGVCSVKLGDDTARLVRELEGEFPKAELIRADRELGDWMSNLLRRLEGDVNLPELPIDVQATAFQRRVYEELKRIPAGETRTYSQVAANLDGELGRRAVARACATNSVAVLIPCHRVVRNDGGMGGYRWGLKRKEELLARERGDKSS
ncbi:MAG: bifunctional DNA-binding transcriptional regulator/O6-methylguanine-DNA methyltransferase Ada [Acidobacteria bacterium]|nr:bifunctional DNA-binding transcriptional regulator/O6-methylguanine-DNA methyltransferase Ada [Acidobacteriota bacterium]